MNALSIGEVAKRSELHASTIRYYEKIGILERTERVNGQRRFSRDVMDILEMIRFAKMAGFTLKEINILLEGFSATEPPSAKWLELAQAKLIEVNIQLEKIQQIKSILEKGLRCECLRFDECVVLDEYGR
jgi:MerR family transcriptional regulator, redox-sensitive transcriptional activator SoxR